MDRKFLTIVLLFAFISCGSSESNSVTESIEPIETTTSTQLTTKTTSDNRTEFTHNWGIEFTDQEIKKTFGKFFDLKEIDASVVSEEIFYQTAGFELDECIEIFEDDFINESWSDEYGVDTTEEWCQRIVILETEKTFEYPFVKEDISISCKSEFNLYMDSFVENYIKENTFERTWFNNSFFLGTSEIFGIGVVNNDVTYLSFLFDIFPAGEGAYLFNDWFEINYNFKTCSPIVFEEIIEVPENYKSIFPELEKYTYDVSGSTLIAHTIDLKICGENNLFCKPFLYVDEFEYYPYTLDFLINERGLIINLGDYFIHRGPNYRFLKWEEIELVSTKFVLDTVYKP